MNATLGRAPWRSLLALLCLASAPSLAAEPLYASTAPSVNTQLTLDETPIPADQAAIFLPRLAEGHVHPQATLVDGATITVIPVGQRVLVQPGRYVVVVGSGAPEDAVSIPIITEAGRTTVVPARWGALDLALLRPNGKAVGTEDVVIRRAASGSEVTLPKPLETDETPSVLLLAPGLYEVESTTTDDILTVHVPEGGLVRFEATARRSGRLTGGRVVTSTIPDPPSDPQGWSTTLMLGADANMGQTAGYVGVADLLTVAGAVSFDVDAAYRKGPHTFSLQAGLQMGAFLYQAPGASALPLIKTRDRLYLGTEYRIGFRKGLGLYIRGGGDTQLLPTWVPVTEPLTATFTQLDGSVDRLTLGTGQTFRIADAFAPTTARASAGLYGDLIEGKVGTLGLRIGPAYRYFWFRNAYVLEDDADTAELEFRQVGNLSLFGADATLGLTLRANKVFRFSTDVDVFVPFRSSPQLIVAWNGGLHINVGGGFALQYSAGLVYAPQITSNLSFQQSAGLRWSFDVL